MKYRSNLDHVLRGVDFAIKSKEKIGVVGRTGAGKSSLIGALFRLIEIDKGCIEIDGVDTKSISLRRLRSSLSIIPQDPVLFSGTIRTNLDPFQQCSDKELWEVLERIKLRRYVKNSAKRLESEITENGANLSVGQRQLICIGRAVIKQSRILVLDEATSSVDNETDSLIQQMIRTQFKDCTVITIAHRLNTVMDSDRILVMDKGSAIEFDSPSNLINAKGPFAQLVEAMGRGSAEKLKLIARHKSESNLLEATIT
jgi:ABC-type multidrug transport system fused ATPase/permease subunit